MATTLTKEEKLQALREMTVDNLEAVGQSMVQTTRQMHTEVIGDKSAGFLHGTNIQIERWYHDKDGTFSDLNAFDHNYYKDKVDKNGEPFGYTGEPSEEWVRKQEGKQKCMVYGCDYMVPVSYTVDPALLELIGLKPIPPERQARAAQLYHIKTTHRNTWSAIVSSGQLTSSEIEELGN